MASTGHSAAGEPRPVEVVCFGVITPCIVVAVEQFPQHNTGALITGWGEFIYDDAAIVAGLLRGWQIPSGLIGTALGDDRRGREVVRQLREVGVQGEFRLAPDLETPLEIDVSDPSGARTYFWRREREILDTLDSADLSLLEGTRMLYVDWYDGDHILRAMDEADRLGIPVFLNLEHGHRDPELLDRYTRKATICQAVTDVAQRRGDPLEVAETLLEAGAGTALVTLGADGCLAASRDERLRVRPPRVSVVDGAAAGATFSAGYLYGYLRGWDLEESVRFATAAASLKCKVVGPRAFPPQEIESFARGIIVEHVSISL
ncbi:MAG: carbohydrate kinase family protein [Chloroflexi bacterium]|nr:carbohydrate kinase family protein [Chloroflexota bacterium]